MSAFSFNAIPEAAQAMARRHNLEFTTVSWEDCARRKTDLWGTCATDLTLRAGGTALPILREPNYLDRTWDVPTSDIGLIIDVGSQPLYPSVRVTLQNYLKTHVNPSRSFFADRDIHAVVSAQACFLPLPSKGEYESDAVLFNVALDARQPDGTALLVILATSKGTTSMVLPASSGLQDLYFCHNGNKVRFLGERLSKDRESRGVVFTGPMTEREKEDNMIMVIQVPLCREETRANLFGGLAPSTGPVGFGIAAAPPSLKKKSAPAPWPCAEPPAAPGSSVFTLTPCAAAAPPAAAGHGSVFGFGAAPPPHVSAFGSPSAFGGGVSAFGSPAAPAGLSGATGFSFGASVAAMPAPTAAVPPARAAPSGGSFTFGCSPPSPVAAPAAAGSFGYQTPPETDVEDVIVKYGSSEGPFVATSVSGFMRDARFPIRVALQFFKGSSNGVITQEIVDSVAAQLKNARREPSSWHINPFGNAAWSQPPAPVEDPKHPGVKCSYCDKPIHGIRYKCAVCPNLNMCGNCPLPFPGLYGCSGHVMLNIADSTKQACNLYVQNRSTLVHRVACSGCAQNPIIGLVYVCTPCGIQHCEKCDAHIGHQTTTGHNMVRVSRSA